MVDSASSKRWVLYNSETKMQSIPVDQEEMQWTVLRMRMVDWKKYFVWCDGWQSWQPLDHYLRSNQRELIIDFSAKENEPVEDTQTATVRVERFDVTLIPDSNDQEQNKSLDNGEQIINDIVKKMTIVDWDDHISKMFRKENEQDFCGDQFDPSMKKNDDSRNPIHFKPTTFAQASYQNREERHSLKIEVLFINAKGKMVKSFSRNISLTGTLIDDDLPQNFLEPRFEIVLINRYAKSPQNSRVQLVAQCPVPSAPNRIKFLEVKPEQRDKLKKLLEQYLKDQKEMMSKAS